MEKDHGLERLCFHKPPTGDEAEEQGRTDLHMDHREGHGGDVKRQRLEGAQRHLLKLRLDDRPHQIPAPEELFHDRHHHDCPEDPEENRQYARQDTDLKRRLKGEGVVARATCPRHPGIKSDPQHDRAETEENGVLHPGRGGILALVSGLQPPEQAKNHQRTGAVKPPTLFLELLPDKEETHEQDERGHERETRAVDEFFHPLAGT